MVRFLTSAVSAALLFSMVSAVPVDSTETDSAETDIEEPTVDNLLGFDERQGRKGRPSGVVPTIQYVDNDTPTNDTLTELDPFLVDDEELERRYVNGADDRYQYTSKSFPFNAVGKLQWSNGVFCSGAMIGPRHVLTAKHCLVDGGATATFSPGYDKGAPFGSGQVTNVLASGYTWGSPCGYKGDWAVMIINQRLGEKTGYFGVKLPESSKVGKSIFEHVGYPGDKDNGNRPYRVKGNPILASKKNFDCDATGPYYTDTDCMGGQSGGPHWETVNGGPYIWGTLSVTFKSGDSAWAGWGSGNQMLDAVTRMRKDYP